MSFNYVMDAKIIGLLCGHAELHRLTQMGN